MLKKYENFITRLIRNKPEVEEKWYENGQKRFEIWYLNNKIHREDGPANQWWYESGQKKIESWSLNGNKHREDGIAYQTWYENGQKYSESWYLNGKDYTREEWIEKLKEIGSSHYTEQKMLFDAEKYNI